MAIFSTLTAALALSPFIAGAAAHTEEQVQNELNLRRHVTVHSKRALDRCAGSPAATALKERAIARRAAKAETLREKRGLQNRQMHRMRRRDDAALEKWAAVSHDQSSEGFTLDTPATDLFAANTTCALVPETVIGPYYVAGELIRTDITDGQSGVPVHLDIQFVDVSTCEGVSSLLIDIWHCNSTGVYSGVANEGQGGLDSTHGRGVQESDSDGVVEFDTLFPGHYTGRATHIHVMSTADAEQFDNGTFTGGMAKHIGQMYFDGDLINEVEALEPYSTNTQSFTDNASDSLAPDEATDEYDPFLNYVALSDNLSDGLLMWIMIAIDTSADYSDSVSAAAQYYEDGGVANENAGMGGGGPGAGGPGGPGGPDANSTAPLPTDAATGTSVIAGETTISSSTSLAGAARPRVLFF